MYTHLYRLLFAVDIFIVYDTHFNNIDQLMVKSCIVNVLYKYKHSPEQHCKGRVDNNCAKTGYIVEIVTPASIEREPVQHPLIIACCSPQRPRHYVVMNMLITLKSVEHVNEEHFAKFRNYSRVSTSHQREHNCKSATSD